VNSRAVPTTTKTRETSALIGYYFCAHGKLRSVDGVASIENVEAQIERVVHAAKDRGTIAPPEGTHVQEKESASWPNMPTAVILAVAISALAIVSSFAGLMH
jgi:hypothetical protein